MIARILVPVALAAAAAAQGVQATRPASSFIPPDHVGEGLLDCVAARECGLLEELRTWLEEAKLGGLERRMGLSFDDLRRVRVYVGPRPARAGEPVDFRANVAIFEGSEKVVLPAADELHKADRLRDYDVLIRRDEGPDPSVRVGVAPGLLVYGKLRLVEPLLSGAQQAGKSDPELAALTAGSGVLAHVALVFPSSPAKAAATPRLSVAKLSRKRVDDTQVFALELVVRFAEGADMPARAGDVHAALQRMGRDPELAPFHATLARLAVSTADRDLIGRMEFATGRELLDTLGGIVPLLWARVSEVRAQVPLEKARVDVRSIHDAAQFYRLKNGGWPTLEQLTTPDGRGKVFLEAVPQDPWGRDYVLRAAEGGKLVVLSLGPDGAEGTADDIASGPRQP